MAQIKAYLSKNCSVCDDQKKEFKRLKNIKIKKIDVDKPSGSKQADKLGIRYLPALTFCKNGKCKRKEEFMTAEEIEKEL